MRRTAFIAALMAVFCLPLTSQTKQQLDKAFSSEGLKAFQEQRNKLYQWDSFKFLMGQWKTEAAAAAGIEVVPSLDNKVLLITNSQPLHKTGAVRKRRDGYKSLTIVYLEGLTPRATFFDNEGRVVTYDVQTAHNKLVLTSVAAGAAARSRVIYQESRAGAINIEFESAPARSMKFAPVTKIGAVRTSR